MEEVEDIVKCTECKKKYDSSRVRLLYIYDWLCKRCCNKYGPEHVFKNINLFKSQQY